jgi:hypothetical protein
MKQGTGDCSDTNDEVLRIVNSSLCSYDVQNNSMTQQTHIYYGVTLPTAKKDD